MIWAKPQPGDKLIQNWIWTHKTAAWEQRKQPAVSAATFAYKHIDWTERALCHSFIFHINSIQYARYGSI